MNIRNVWGVFIFANRLSPHTKNAKNKTRANILDKDFDHTLCIATTCVKPDIVELIFKKTSLKIFILFQFI